MKIHQSILLLLCAITLASCTKDAVQDDDITEPVSGAALVKFFNFGVGAPAVNFFANDTKMTAINSTTASESTFGTVYGGVGAGGLYTRIVPGQYNLGGRIAAVTDKGLAISTLSAPLADGKLYSFYQSGIYSSASKSVDAFIVEDNLPPIDYSVACVRFVNAISNSNPMTLYARDPITSTEVAIGGEVAYKSAGTFTCLPEGSYNLSVRVAGSATNAISRTGVSFGNGRVYTIASRGDMNVRSTTAATRPILDSTFNR